MSHVKEEQRHQKQLIAALSINDYARNIMQIAIYAKIDIESK